MIFSGTKMGIESVGRSSTGVMVIFAGSYVIEGGDLLTYDGTNYSVNCSATFSLLLNVNDAIYVTANSGSSNWLQESYLFQIVHFEI